MFINHIKKLLSSQLLSKILEIGVYATQWCANFVRGCIQKFPD